MVDRYERLIGYIGDLVCGVASKDEAKLFDCPECGKPLDIAIGEGNAIALACPADQGHLSWRGTYEELPAWIGQYRQLNVDASEGGRRLSP